MPELRLDEIGYSCFATCSRVVSTATTAGRCASWIAEAFRERLQKVARFAYVPPPMPMRNSKGAVVYYLYFASPNRTGGKIVGDIFDKYRNAGVA